MASGKRASMREGPLAALFRRTDEEPERDGERRDTEPAPAAEQPPPARPRAEAPSAPVTPRPATPAGQDQRRAPQPPAQQRAPEPQRQTPQPRPASEPEDDREASAHPRETGYPHPSLGATPPPVEDDAPRVPSPQERLRHAFTTDIPENILDAPREPIRYDREPEPAAPPYPRAAHEEPTPWGQAKPVGHPVIRVVGVGGAGVNAVNRMVEAEIEGIEFLAVNTDLQSLQQSTADITLHIGPDVTRGLGAGSDPNLGRAAAMDEYDRIKALLKGSDMIFIAAGAGGGTGTGAAPVVARIAREVGALTVGIV
ncbi:MAG: cell division protein FtsZ, partial [Solirubrobacteraceae bacterium]|nr:cell division protein FtsZ [Solirubrobacteraceae bacterium]